MKRALIIVGIFTCTAVVLTSMNYQSFQSIYTPSAKKKCFGYTVIEAGKGIDCNGDTLLLKKNSGYYEVVSAFEEETAEVVSAN